MNDSSPTASPSEANLSSTSILNHSHSEVKTIVTNLSAAQPGKRDFVKAAHSFISRTMHAVYSVDEARPASETLRLNEGSCGQRMACVEALARGYEIPTRVRALWLDKRFWYSRLPLLRFFLPKRTLMPWPQFYLDSQWVDFDEIYAPLPNLAAHAPYSHPFSNKGESLFDAVRHTPVDFFGKLRQSDYASYDISSFVVEDGGFFDTRDELLTKYGEKPSWFGKLIFHLLYERRLIRRQPD